MVFNDRDYRDGARLRLHEAQRLYDSRHWGGATYLGGRAVEGMLRSLLWLRSRQQEVGHDLRQLLRRAESLGLLEAADRARIADQVNELAIVWHNSLRFASDAAFDRWLKALGRHVVVNGRRVFGPPAKANAKSALEASELIVSRGELIWRRLHKG